VLTRLIFSSLSVSSCSGCHSAPLRCSPAENASGKSSVLQALVLLHQTMREHEWSTRLLLNGASLRMGTVTDVVDKVNGRYTFESASWMTSAVPVTFTGSDRKCPWR